MNRKPIGLSVPYRKVKKDPYASEQETNALIKPDKRTPYQKMLDQMLETNGASEMGADSYMILYKIATDLLEALYHDTPEKP